MKKRMLTLFLVFAILLAMAPAAGAAETDITDTGVVIWPQRNGSDGPTPSGTYRAGSGTLEWDLTTLTITLTNATINATNAQYGNALEIPPPTSGNPEIKIVLNGTNTITGKNIETGYMTSTGIYSDCPLRISGTGTLTATGGSAASGASTGIDCFGLTVEQGATVNAIGGNAGSHSYGVSSSAEVIVAGTLNATAESGNPPMGMLVNHGLVVEEGGVLTVCGNTARYTSYGINFNNSDMPITVNGTLIAVAFAPFGNKNASYQNKVIIKGSDNESGTDLYGFLTNPVSFPATYNAKNPKYIIITPDSKTPQADLTITGKPEGTIHYGDTFTLGTSGGSGEGAVTWSASGAAEVDANTGAVTVTGVGDVTITATKAGDDAYMEAAATCTFTSEKAAPSVGNVTCSAAIHPGTDPATITLTHSGTTGGTVRLAGSTKFEVGTKEYDWIFTPDDTANYTTAGGKISLTVTQAALSGITVTTQPAQKTYTVGETFNPAGMVVTASYADGTEAAVTGYQVQYAGGDAFKIGDTSVTLSYTEGSVTKTVALTGLTVSKKTTAPLSAEVSARYDDTAEQVFDFSGLLPSDCGAVSGVTVSSIASSEILASATGDQGTKAVSWALKPELAGEEKSETLTVTVSTENYEDITISLKVTATVKTPVAITGVTAQDGTYNGKAHTGYTGTPAAAGYAGEFAITYSGGSAPVGAGSYTVTIGVPAGDASYTGSVTLAFQVEKAVVTVKADDKTATVGGSRPELTATVSGLADGEVLKTQPTLACDADMATAGSYAIAASGAAVPDGGNYQTEIVYQPGTLTVRAASPGNPGSGGGGGSSSSSSATTTTNHSDGSTTTIKTDNRTGTVTETTRKPDGSQTVVETQKDGTVTTTETDKDGNKAETVAKPDGSSVTTVARKDGASAVVTTDVEGNVQADVKLTAAAVSSAQLSGAVVPLPIPQLQAARDSGTAPIVTVDTGSGEAVKVEIPVVEPTPGTVAVIVRADGTEEIIKTSIPTESGVAVEVPDGASLKLVDNGKHFADVSDGNWAADAVEFASARELFSGTSENTFSPELPMTRAMLVTVLARFDGTDTTNGSTWYEKGMEWAVDGGISDGNDPDGTVTREQLAVMLWRYAGSPAVDGQALEFADAGQVSDWAQAALCWAVDQGILTGRGGNILAPSGSATRAESAQILKNFLENIS